MSGGRIQQWIAYNSDSLDPSKPVHPCFLYESLWCITGFILLYIVFRKWRRFDGQMILMYVLWYGTGRFFIEGLRSDSLYIGTIKVSQLLSLLGAVAALIVLIIGLSYVRRNRDSYRLYVETRDGGSTEAAETAAEGRDAAENEEEENQINDIKE
jgi:phosphatidylglycerol:prolipoprotein diacylglycerol transferase